MSNLFACREFTYQTYSAPVAQPAGEKQANTNYVAQFSFITTTPEAQPGLYMTVSPDSHEGSRMAWVSLEDTAAGTQLTFSDSPDPDGEFVDYEGPLLKRGVPHSIKFSIKLNPGPDDDLVRIAVDGRDVGQCFTTWENYYRTASEQAPPPNVNQPATLSSLQFRSSVGGFDGVNGGYLFDNVSVTTDNGPGPRGCNLAIDKKADSPTVTAGSRAGYQITVRNRGRLDARNFRACEHVPRHTTFVSADRKLVHLGRQRCLEVARLAPGQQASFHVVLHVAADAPQGTLDNLADVTPGTGPPDLLPPVADLPPAAQAKVKAAVKTRVIARIKVRRAARGLPRVTG